MCEQRRTKLPRQLAPYLIDRSAGQSTLDDEFGAGDIGCIIGGKEQSQPCDVFRFCEPLDPAPGSHTDSMTLATSCSVPRLQGSTGRSRRDERSSKDGSTSVRWSWRPSAWP